jgi:hypothetical protein
MNNFSNDSHMQSKSNSEAENWRLYSREVNLGIPEEFSNDRLPSGWWMLPGTFFGLILWIFIIRFFMRLFN